jgi:protein tyrosine/serine phosphatase
MLYRSARPDESSLADRNHMRSVLGIKTIIDLRTFTEHRQQAEKHYSRLKNGSGESVDDVEDRRPLRIANIDYMDINFNGYAYSRHLIMQLAWLDFFRFLFVFAIGRHLEAISIIGLNVMQPRGLAGLAIDSIDVCQSEVKAVFAVLADRARYPILIHCTQGKDRTGLVVQLVLMLLGVPMEAIDNDYMISSYELAPEKNEKLLEVQSIGLTDDFVDCEPDLVYLVDRHIRNNYGSVERYLVEAGVSLQMQLKVKQILCPRRGFEALTLSKSASLSLS